MDPKTQACAAQNSKNRAKSKVVCQQGSRSLVALRDLHRENSSTQEYPSLIQTFFDTHTVRGEFVDLEEKALYEEMIRLESLGPRHLLGCALHRRGDSTHGS